MQEHHAHKHEHGSGCSHGHDNDSHDGHDHDHEGHSHGQVVLGQKLGMAFIIAIGLNSLLTVLQIFYAYTAHSTSLLADAGHHLSDVLALIFSFVATLLAKKNSNNRYSYGYKKSTVLATLTNATLLVVACTIILMEAIDHLIYQHTVNAIPVMVVAALGAVISGISAMLLHKDSHHDLNIKSAFLHLWYDALLSIGVVVTGGLIYFTHISLLDPIVGILLALFILKNSWQLFKETLNLSLDGVPKAIDLTKVSEFLHHIPGVTRVHDLHIWALSTSSNALTVHLIRPQGLLSSEERQHISQQLQQLFKIDHTTIQIETHEEADCEHEQSC
jgi:cobalt-zinc-cadmium efflux system protein